MVSLVFLGCMCLPGQADALFGWGQKRKGLNSDKVVKDHTRAADTMTQRFTASIQRGINPCWAPACTSEAAIERCAKAKGLALADYMETAENFFVTTGPEKKFVYVKVNLRDIDMAAWKADIHIYNLAQKQFESILKKQGDVSGLILEARPGNEDDQAQIESEQIKLQEMQQYYMQFLAQSGLLNIAIFLAEQEKIGNAMEAIGQEGEMPIPRAEQPETTKEKYSRLKERTVRQIRREVGDATKEFATNQEGCLETYCNTLCVEGEELGHTRKEVQDLTKDPGADITQSMVDSVRAKKAIIRAARCSGEDAAASILRVLCTACKGVISSKELIPSCQVAEGEWGKQETAKANSLSGGIF